MKKRKHSEETKKKISEASIRMWKNPEIRKKLVEAHIGKTLTLEQRKKISKANKGRVKSEEERKNISEANRGKVMSKESREKMSRSQMGNKNALGHYAPKKEEHYLWKGQDAGIKAKHIWLTNNYGCADHCELCKRNDNKATYHWANISRTYKREREDYVMLCCSCHTILDRNKLNIRQALDGDIDIANWKKL